MLQLEEEKRLRKRVGNFRFKREKFFTLKKENLKEEHDWTLTKHLTLQTHDDTLYTLNILCQVGRRLWLMTKVKESLQSLGLNNIPMSQAYAKLDSLHKTLGREKVDALKYELLLPFRRKNILLGLGLTSMVFGLFALAMYKATPASFPDLTKEERERMKLEKLS